MTHPFVPFMHPRVDREREDAAEYLRGHAPAGVTLRVAYLAAVRATHPDHGGRREDFERVMGAARLLGIA